MISLDPFYNDCETFIKKYLNTEVNLTSFFSRPPERKFGDLAFACFGLAKALKKSPKDIAIELAHHFSQQNAPFIASIEAVNGYLNFFANAPAIASYLTKESSEFEALSKKSSLEKQNLKTSPHKTMVEYSQPNTHKALHVGHLRGLVVGDAISSILSFCGEDVIRATYPGDNGTHIAKILWYINRSAIDLPLDSLPHIEKSKWLGRMYAEAEGAYQAALEQDKEKTKNELTAIFKDLSAESTLSPFFALWQKTRAWSLETLEALYKMFDSTFDVWDFESACEKSSIQLALKKFDEGFFVKDQGAIGIDLSPWNLGFVLYLKSDGNSLYITKDLELIQNRFEKLNLKKLIYVVDTRQKLHFKQLFKTAELMKIGDEKSFHHLAYETINTENGKAFSSRDLNGLGILDLVDFMKQQVISEHLHRYEQEWSAEDIDKTALLITVGALRYGILKVDHNTQVTFSLKEWLRLDGDTGPYLQYVHSRCMSVLKKMNFEKDPNTDFASLNTPYEHELICHLNDFTWTCSQAKEYLKPAVLAQYLFSLAKIFNRFYEHCSIKDAQSEENKKARLHLVSLTQKTLALGLKILCIPIPERM